jgi:hypothetical protein
MSLNTHLITEPGITLLGMRILLNEAPAICLHALALLKYGGAAAAAVSVQQDHHYFVIDSTSDTCLPEDIMISQLFVLGASCRRP